MTPTPLAEYSTEQLRNALSLALKDRDMPAAASLLTMLAVRAPDEARLIAAVIRVSASLSRSKND